MKSSVYIFVYIYIVTAISVMRFLITTLQVYPVWKWFEKQDGIRSLQKNNKDPAPEFYNIYLERPKVLFTCTISYVVLFPLWTSDHS